jgi:hypothetical protein
LGVCSLEDLQKRYGIKDFLWLLKIAARKVENKKIELQAVAGVRW